MDTGPVAPSSRLGTWLGRGALGVFVLLTLIPLGVAIATAFTPHDALFASSGRFFPAHPTWFNFARVIRPVADNDPRFAVQMLPQIDFFRSLLNSAVFTALVVVPQIFFSALAAYAFARLKFPGSRAVFFLFIAASMVPM